MSQILEKTSVGIAGGTIGTGQAATYLDWIPSDIGKLASLIGCVLSVVLIIYWTQRIRLTSHESKLKMLELEHKLAQAEEKKTPH